MKTFLILIMIMLSGFSFAETPKCSALKVNIVGKYGDMGENSSPWLDMWSEASGNLTAIEVRSQKAFTKAVLVLKNDKSMALSQVEFTLVKNKASSIDLISEVKKQKDVKFLDLQLFAGNTIHEFCHEDTAVIEQDGTGVREVKNAKAVK